MSSITRLNWAPLGPISGHYENWGEETLSATNHPENTGLWSLGIKFDLRVDGSAKTPNFEICHR
jgi:hypothetical protein